MLEAQSRDSVRVGLAELNRDFKSSGLTALVVGSQLRGSTVRLSFGGKCANLSPLFI